jgi:hypothetical protein
MLGIRVGFARVLLYAGAVAVVMVMLAVWHRDRAPELATLRNAQPIRPGSKQAQQVLAATAFLRQNASPLEAVAMEQTLSEGRLFTMAERSGLRGLTIHSRRAAMVTGHETGAVLISQRIFDDYDSAETVGTPGHIEAAKMELAAVLRHEAWHQATEETREDQAYEYEISWLAWLWRRRRYDDPVHQHAEFLAHYVPEEYQYLVERHFGQTF